MREGSCERWRLFLAPVHVGGHLPVVWDRGLRWLDWGDRPPFVGEDLDLAVLGDLSDFEAEDESRASLERIYVRYSDDFDELISVGRQVLGEVSTEVGVEGIPVCGNQSLPRGCIDAGQLPVGDRVAEDIGFHRRVHEKSRWSHVRCV